MSPLSLLWWLRVQSERGMCRQTQPPLSTYTTSCKRRFRQELMLRILPPLAGVWKPVFWETLGHPYPPFREICNYNRYAQLSARARRASESTRVPSCSSPDHGCRRAVPRAIRRPALGWRRDMGGNTVARCGGLDAAYSAFAASRSVHGLRIGRRGPQGVSQGLRGSLAAPGRSRGQERAPRCCQGGL